jgi:hypothetical protein
MHIWVGEEGLVALMQTGVAENGIGGGRATARDGDEARVVRVRQRLGEGACDAAGSQNAPVQ